MIATLKTRLGGMTTWRPIPGYETKYEVSDDGQVKSLSDRYGRERILKHGITKTGHHQVVLCVGGTRKAKYVHRLMLEVFVGPCPPGYVTRHIDGDPDNNTLGNIAWGTEKENQQDSLRHGTHWLARRTQCKNGHSLEGARPMRRDGREYGRYCAECAKDRYNARRGG